MRTTTHRTSVTTRGLAVAAVLALTGVTTACGSEDPAEASSGADSSDQVVDGAGDVAVESVVGLEVTVVGNVSERLSTEALRVDRDGLGESTGSAAPEASDDDDYDYDYDYDYYDYDGLTEYDEDFGDDEFADEGVLVVSATGLDRFEEDAAVRVSGTLRRFDQDVIESLYEIDLAGDVFDDYEDSMVIVADSVRAADSPAASDGAGS